MKGSSHYVYVYKSKTTISCYFPYFSLILTSSVEVAMIMYLFTSFLCVTTKVLVVLVLSFVIEVRKQSNFLVFTTFDVCA